MAHPPGPLDREGRKQFVHLLSEGMSRSAAAQMVGTTTTAVRRLAALHPDFAEAIEHVMAAKNEAVEEALFTTALRGNVEAQKFWLTNRAGEEWSNTSRVEHTGRNGGPIAIAQAATVALRTVLGDGDSRERALTFIDAQLAPARAEGPLEEDSDSGQRRGYRLAGEVVASLASDGDEPGDHEVPDRP